MNLTEIANYLGFLMQVTSLKHAKNSDFHIFSKQKAVIRRITVLCGVRDGSRTHDLQGHNLAL